MSRRHRVRTAPVTFATLLMLLRSVAGLGNETVAAKAAIIVTASPPAAAAPTALVAPSEPVAPALLSHARRRNADRSTSSSSGEPRDADGSGSAGEDKKESLDLDTMSDLTADKSKGDKGRDKYRPKSSDERRGWRKWHRKCTPCPEQSMKWRDPRVLWICGGYQRARRSFKSACMMRYRNCQDGTMFVKLYDHRCKPDVPGEPRPHGDHFFYTYDARISGDDTKEYDRSSSGIPSDSSDSSGARRRAMDWQPDFPANSTAANIMMNNTV